MLFYVAALLTVILDQLTKTWVRAYAEGSTIFKAGFIHFTHVTNTGAAFGLFKDASFLLTVFAAAGAAAILLFVTLTRRTPLMNSQLIKLALGLILGGALGNLTDRLLIGHVTDFIGIGIWPNFNIADSAVVTGSILLGYTILFLKTDDFKAALQK